jgi:hypothetical protein
VSPTVACPNTMAFPHRVAVETVVIARVVKAALAIFIDPGVGRGARTPPGQGKAHHEKAHRENDNPLHVWPTEFASCHTMKRSEPGQVPYASGTSS